MKTSAVLLAGGESRRFGEDKATFQWRGKALWERQLQTLRDTNPVETLISAREKPAWLPDDVRFVADAQPSCGPLGGLVAALSLAHGSHLLVLAIDMPLMTSGYLRDLMAQVKPGCGIVPMLNEMFEPLAAVYPLEAGTLLREIHDQQKDFSLQSALRSLIQAGRMTTTAAARAEEVLFQNFNQLSDTRSPCPEG